MLRNRLTTRQALRRFTLGSGPLKRTSDRLQCLARVALTLALLSAVAVALAVATATFTHGKSEALVQAAERQKVSAQLLEDASALSDGPGIVPDAGQATAAWTDPAGVEHTAAIRVPAGADAGSMHTIWVDRNGDRTTRPLSDRDVAGRSVGIAVTTYLWTSLIAWGAYRSVRGLLDRSRSRQWAAEWAVVEPEWTGKVP
jgi:hypothetical protein